MKESNDDDDRPAIVIDPYRVILHARPSDLGDPSPRAWREVASQVNSHLMRIATGPTRLIAEILESATRIVRGIARVPDAVANRVDRAHGDADAIEGKAQKELLHASLHPASDEALTTIRSVLTRYRVRGHHAEVVRGARGEPQIVIVRSDMADVLAEAEQTDELSEHRSIDDE